MKHRVPLFIEPVLLKSRPEFSDVESQLMALLCRRTLARSETGFGALGSAQGQEQ